MSQEFDNNVLDLVKQKGLYPYEYMTDKEKFYSLLTCKKLVTKNTIMLLRFGTNLK